MPSVLRRYDDDSAPGLSGNTPGSLISLLKAVLVDGYGTQPALGWTLEFEDTVNHKAVFRPGGTGIRPHVQVTDNIPSTSYQYARVTAYESMTDVDIGIGPCPPSLTDDYGYLPKCATNVSTNMPWVIIGDELGFWLLVRIYDTDGTATDNGSLYVACYIGYWTSNHSENNYNFCTILTNKYLYGYFTSSSSSYNKYTMRHPVTKEKGAIPFSCYWHYSRGYLLGCSYVYHSPINGRYIYYPCMMYLDSDPTYGTIPGILHQLWKREGTYSMDAEEREEFYDYNGDTTVFCFALRHELSGYSSSVSRGAIIIGKGFRNAY